MSSGKWRPSCLDLNVLINTDYLFCSVFLIFRPGGKVPCIAIGDDQIIGHPESDANTRHFDGIAFQPVATGTIRPLLPVSEFKPISWQNSPTTRGARIRRNFDFKADIKPSPDLGAFCDQLSSLKRQLLLEVISIHEASYRQFSNIPYSQT